MNQDSGSRSAGRVSPVCLIRMLLRHLWMPVAAALILAMGTSLVSQWFHEDLYRASMTYAVTSRETSYVSNRNLTVTREVAAVMTDMLKTDTVLAEIREADPELAGFRGTIQAAQVGESNLITVSVQSASAEDAFRAIRVLVDIFPSMTEYLTNKCVLQVIQNPSVSAAPVNGLNVRKNAITAGAVGAALVALLLCWISISRETVQTTRGARTLLDASILGVVGHQRKHRTLKSLLLRKKTGLQVFDPGTGRAYA